MLATITLQPGHSQNIYPFSVPAIQSLTSLRFTSRITSSRAKTAPASPPCLNPLPPSSASGSRAATATSPRAHRSPTRHRPLTRALRLTFDNRSGEGFFFRAECLYNVATSTIDEPRPRSQRLRRHLPPRPSHGETFFTVLHHKFRRTGLFLLDEPEAALSPQRQLSLLIMIHHTLADYRDAQFILSTHSPILLGYPGAQILSFDDGTIHEIHYRESTPSASPGASSTDPDPILEELFRPEPTLFDEE